MRPIFIDETSIERMVEEFRESLKKTCLVDGSVTYTRRLGFQNAEKKKAEIEFSPLAYQKMVSIIRDFSTEIGWHGTVERTGDASFLIKDILVYPQEVTAATVNTDQEEYQKWIIKLDDDTANSMRMQGHSHVNMSCGPSTTDLTHQRDLLESIGHEGYYIFMIWNKRLEREIKVYDLDNNILYENADVDVKVGGQDDLSGFLAEAKKLCRAKYADYTGTTYSSPAYGGTAYSSYSSQTKTKEKGGKKEKGYTGYSGYSRKIYDDDDLPSTYQYSHFIND